MNDKELEEYNKLIHVVTNFVAGVARTSCGDYANADKVSAYRDKATCKKCRGEKE